VNVLVKAGVRLLEVLFFGGCIGSFIVVVVAGIEDFATVFERGGQSENGNSGELSTE
jgi:hypothetical protein